MDCTTIKVGEAEYSVAANAFTPIIYGGEFSKALTNGKRGRKDINDAMAEINEAMETSGIPPMATLLECFWAFCKTADRSTPPFAKWLEGIDSTALLALNMEDGWSADMMRFIQEAFFPAKKDVETEG